MWGKKYPPSLSTLPRLCFVNLKDSLVCLVESRENESLVPYGDSLDVIAFHFEVLICVQ